MRKVVLLLFVLAISSGTAFCQVNGHVEVIDGKPVLWTWGTHAERGYAHGYLRGEEAKEVFDDYFVDFFSMGSTVVYGYLRSLFENLYYVDAKYQAEAEGMIQGMIDSGVDLHNETLGRDLDATDILVSNSIVDLSQEQKWKGLGCSSLSSWGTSTASDPTLTGHLVVTRHLDWSKHQTLTDNPLVIVQFPSEPDEQPWISVTYAGFIGALSSINESGIGAFLDMANVTTVNGGAPYHPILLTVRNGIEARDYNEDGENTPDDIVAAIQDKSRSAATLVHVTKDDGWASRPIIIESNNENGVAVRDVTDNTLIPGDNLAVTNHFRVLYPPVPCSRYEAIADSLNANPNVSIERGWMLVAGAAGQSSNIQAIEYVESEGLPYFALDTYTEPAYAQEPTVFDIEDLFGCPMGVDEVGPGAAVLMQNVPNPFNPRTSLVFSLAAPARSRLTVYDVSGRFVKTLLDGALAPGEHRAVWDGTDATGEPVPSGVYFYRLETDDAVATRRMVLLR